MQLELDTDEALVLFEWLSKNYQNLPKDTDIWSDPNQMVFSALLSQLETALIEPFAANYDELYLAACRRMIAKNS